MSDPELLAAVAGAGASVGSSIAASAVTSAIKALAGRATAGEWERTDALGKLFLLVEAMYGARAPSLTVAKMEAQWRGDDAFRVVYERFVAQPVPEVDVADFAAAIRPLLDDLEASLAAELAVEIASVMHVLHAETVSGDDLFRFQFAALNSELARRDRQLAELQAARHDAGRTVVVVAADWPGASDGALTHAKEADPEGLAKLIEALDGGDPRGKLSQVVNHSRAWTETLKAPTWVLVAVRCVAEGLWQEAAKAWLRVRELPGADFAGATVRAAEIYHQIGDSTRANGLLCEARNEQPDHPRVRLQEAISQESPEAVLDALGRIDAADLDTTIQVHLATASTYLDLSDVESARASLEAARDGGAGDSTSYTFTALALNFYDALGSVTPDAGKAEQDRRACLDLEAVLLRRGLPIQAATLRSYAAGLFANLGEISEAVEVLRNGARLYVDGPSDARRSIALTAAQLDAWSVVDDLIKAEDTHDAAQLLRAFLATADGTPPAEDTVRALDELVQSSDSRVALLAASRLLLLSSMSPEVPWNERAYERIASHDLRAAVTARVRLLESTGESDGAVRLLLQHGEHRWAITDLMVLHARAQNWEQAARYARQVLDREASWESQLSAAEALRSAGHRDGPSDEREAAIRTFDQVANDARAPTWIREKAYGRLIDDAFYRSDLAAAKQHATDLLRLCPDNEDAAWVCVRVDTIFGHHTEAMDRIERLRLVPRLPDEFRIVTTLYPLLLPPDEAVPRLLDLTQAKDAPAEDLEAAAIRMLVRGGSHALPADVAEQLTPGRFLERYPDSEYLRPIDFDELVRDYVEPDGVQRKAAEEANQAAQEMIYGLETAPTAVAAMALGVEVSELWRAMTSNDGLPLSYGHTTLHALEVADAEAAIGNPVLFDPSSVFIASRLPRTIATAIKRAFPGAHITVSALALLAETSRRSTEARHGSGGSSTAETGSSSDEIRVLEFAQALRPVADLDPTDPQPNDKHADASEPAILGLAGTFGVSQRLQLPVLSDDRDLRRRLRLSGQPTFGSVALTEALTRREHISPEDLRTVRECFIGLRGLGLRLTADELITMGTKARWCLTHELRVFALDRHMWRSDPGHTIQVWVEVLRAVHRLNPEKFRTWLLRVVDAALEALPGYPSNELAVYIATFALAGAFNDTSGFFRELIYHLRRVLDDVPGPPIYTDLAVDAYEQLVLVTQEYKDREAVSLVIARALTVLPLAAQPLAAQLITS